MGTTAEPGISSLLAQIQSLGGSATSGNALDPTKKKQLRLAALKLHRALEDPGDIVERVCFQVSYGCPVCYEGWRNELEFVLKLSLAVVPRDSLHKDCG